MPLSAGITGMNAIPSLFSLEQTVIYSSLFSSCLGISKLKAKDSPDLGSLLHSMTYYVYSFAATQEIPILLIVFICPSPTLSFLFLYFLLFIFGECFTIWSRKVQDVWPTEASRLLAHVLEDNVLSWRLTTLLCALWRKYTLLHADTNMMFCHQSRSHRIKDCRLDPLKPSTKIIRFFH